MKGLMEGERRKTRSVLEAGVGPTSLKEDRKIEGRQRRMNKATLLHFNQLHCLTWQQSIQRGGAAMNPNCSLFATV